MSDTLNVEPSELVSAASSLDRLAANLERSVTFAQSALPVLPQGRDEVSVAAATSFSAVAESFGTDASTAVLELRKIAAVLRAQADGYTEGEIEATKAFKL